MPIRSAALMTGRSYLRSRRTSNHGLLHADKRMLLRTAARLLVSHNRRNPPDKHWGMCAALYEAAKKYVRTLRSYSWFVDTPGHDIAVTVRDGLMQDIFWPMAPPRTLWAERHGSGVYWYSHPMKADDTEARCFALLLAAEIAFPKGGGASWQQNRFLSCA